MTKSIDAIIAERAKRVLSEQFAGWPVRIKVYGDKDKHVYIIAEGIPHVTLGDWQVALKAIVPDGYAFVAEAVDALTGAVAWFVPEEEIVGGDE